MDRLPPTQSTYFEGYWWHSKVQQCLAWKEEWELKTHQPRNSVKASSALWSKLVLEIVTSAPGKSRGLWGLPLSPEKGLCIRSPSSCHICHIDAPDFPQMLLNKASELFYTRPQTLPSQESRGSLRGLFGCSMERGDESREIVLLVQNGAGCSESLYQAGVWQWKSYFWAKYTGDVIALFKVTVFFYPVEAKSLCGFISNKALVFRTER